MSSFGFDYVDNPYGTSTGGPARVRQINPGLFEDESGGQWTGTWENPTRVPNNTPPPVGPPPIQGPNSPTYPTGPDQRGGTNPNPTTLRDDFPLKPPVIPMAGPTGPTGPATTNTTVTTPGLTAQRDPFINTAPPAPPPGPDSYQTGSPNDPNHTYVDARNYLLTLLGQAQYRNNPQAAIDIVNKSYQNVLPSGHSPALYGAGSHGQGSGATIGFDDGYLAQNADGSWGWVDRKEGPGSGGGGGGTGSGQGDYTWAQAIALANQHAGHTLTDAEVDQILKKFNGNTNRPSTVTRAGLQPVLDYLDSNHTGGPTGPTGPNGPNKNPPPGDYGGPGGPGVFTGPTQQVGQDPLSLLTTQALATLMLNGGVHSQIGQQGIDALSEMLGGGNLNKRLESIREKFGLLERSQMNDARGILADRGLLSEGSTAQGPEMSTLGRIAHDISVNSSSAARDAFTQSSGETLQAISQATGLDQQASENILNAANSTSNRQQMLSQVALKSLEDNMDWNKFVAQYGLDRDKLQNDIQNNNMAALLPILNAFLGWFNGATGGFV